MGEMRGLVLFCFAKSIRLYCGLISEIKPSIFMKRNGTVEHWKLPRFVLERFLTDYNRKFCSGLSRAINIIIRHIEIIMTTLEYLKTNVATLRAHIIIII